MGNFYWGVSEIPLSGQYACWTLRNDENFYLKQFFLQHKMIRCVPETIWRHFLILMKSCYDHKYCYGHFFFLSMSVYFEYGITYLSSCPKAYQYLDWMCHNTTRNDLKSTWSMDNFLVYFLLNLVIYFLKICWHALPLLR